VSGGYRLFLDAHVSGRRIAARLRELGFDVRAADEERELDRLDDEVLLEMAAFDERIMVTFDAKDFVPLLQEWAHAGRSHAGCIVLVGLDHSEFETIVRRTAAIVSEGEDAEHWRNVTRVEGRWPN
jgi:Domain of unknown function (DUF5615)